VLSQMAQFLGGAGKRDQAIAMYQQALAVDQSKNNQWQWKHGIVQLYIQQEKYKEAEPLARELVKDAPQDYRKPQANQALATILRKTGGFEAWVRELEAQVTANPKDHAAVRLLAEVHQADRDYDQAAKRYGQLVEMQPTEANYQLWINLLRSAQKDQEVIDAYEQFLKKFPARRSSYLSALVQAYRSAGKPERAIELAQEYAQTNPEQEHPWSQLAAYLSQAKKYDEAIAAYEKAAKQSSHENSRWSYRSAIARTWEQAGRHQEAESAARELMKTATQDSQRQEATRILANILKKSGKLEAFLDELAKKVASNPKVRGALKRLADFCYGRGDYAKAGDLYGKLIDLEATKQNFQQWINCLRKVNRHSEAIKAYERLFEKYPEEKRNQFSSLLYSYQRTGQRDKALELAREHAKANPSNGHALSQVADVLRQLSKHEEAIETYRQAVRIERNESNRSQWRYNIAQIYQSQGKLDEAEKAAREILRDTRNSSYRSNAARLLASVLRASGKLGSFTSELEKQAKANPQDKETLKLLVSVYQAAGNYAKTAGIQRKLLQLEPTASNYTQWISSLGNAQKYAEQVAAYVELMKKFPDQKSGHFIGLMHAYRNAGKADEAIKTGEDYVKSSPKNGSAAGQFAQVLTQMNRLDEALKLYRQAAEEAQNDQQKWQWKYQMAELHLRQGKHEEAESMAQALLKSVPQEHQKRQTNSLIVRILKASGKIDGFISGLREKLEASPPSKELWTQFAQIQQAKGDYSAAADAYGKLVELDPSKNNFHQWTNALSNSQRHGDCAAAIEKLIEEHPGERRNQLQRLMWAYKNAGKNDKAVEAGREYARLNPRNGHSYGQLGDLFRQMGKDEDALQAFQEALKHSPSGSTKWQWKLKVGEIYRDTGKLDEAESLARELVGSPTTGHRARQGEALLVSVLKASGKLDRWTKDLEEKVTANPKDQQALKQLAAVYKGDNRLEAATVVFQQLVAVAPSKNHYQEFINLLSRARRYDDQIEVYEEFFAKYPDQKRNQMTSLLYVYRNAGRVEEAVEAAKEYAKQQPTNSQVMRTLGDTLRQARRYEEALKAYEEALKRESHPNNRWYIQQCIVFAYREMGKTDEAFKAVKELLKTSSQSHSRKQAEQLRDQIIKDMGGI